MSITPPSSPEQLRTPVIPEPRRQVPDAPRRAPRHPRAPHPINPRVCRNLLSAFQRVANEAEENTLENHTVTIQDPDENELGARTASAAGLPQPDAKRRRRE